MGRWNYFIKGSRWRVFHREENGLGNRIVFRFSIRLSQINCLNFKHALFFYFSHRDLVRGYAYQLWTSHWKLSVSYVDLEPRANLTKFETRLVISLTPFESVCLLVHFVSRLICFIKFDNFLLNKLQRWRSDVLCANRVHQRLCEGCEDMMNSNKILFHSNKWKISFVNFIYHWKTIANKKRFNKRIISRMVK